MVLGLPAFPMIALGGYLGYKAWPYLSESKRDIPKEAHLTCIIPLVMEPRVKYR